MNSHSEILSDLFKAAADNGKIGAVNKLPKGYRITLKKDPSGVYFGQIWKDGVSAGSCPVADQRQDVARQAATDWAWEMSGEERPDDPFSTVTLSGRQAAASLTIHEYFTKGWDTSNRTDTNQPNFVPQWIGQTVDWLKEHPEDYAMQRRQLQVFFWKSKDQLAWLYEDAQ